MVEDVFPRCLSGGDPTLHNHFQLLLRRSIAHICFRILRSWTTRTQSRPRAGL